MLLNGHLIKYILNHFIQIVFKMFKIKLINNGQIMII